MSGERKLLFTFLWVVLCLATIITGPWGKWIDFIAVTGLFVAFILTLLVLQGAAISKVTRNVKKEWKK